jgi:predicted esterase
MNNSFFHLKIDHETSIAYLGPPIEKGPLPAFFYLSLSAKDSLTLDPYNQPAKFLSSQNIRIFSMTLPGHDEGLDPTKALVVWAEEIYNGTNPIEKFVTKLEKACDYLIQRGAILSEKVAIGGLSRGAFVATHAAARIPLFRKLLGFAPLTRLSFAKEFQQMQNNALVHSLSLISLVDALTDRKVRFYIGNRDTRVGTAFCFQFIEALSEAAFQKNIRSPQAELIISPSIGQQGHGTGPDTFRDGVKWIAKGLEIEDG